MVHGGIYKSRMICVGRLELPGYYEIMNQKQLGKTSVHLPEIGLGTSNYNGGSDPLRKGIELGAVFIDTAERYGSEGIVAEALRGLRERVFAATKLSPAHFKRKDVLKAADQSLRQLKVGFLDLYQLHEPSPTVPIEETMAAMEDLVDAGKVRFIGVSNFSVRQLKKAQAAMRKQTIVSNQVRYSMIDRTIEKELLPYCQENGITVIGYSPLARGISNLRQKDPQGILGKVAGEIGVSEAQVALNWCIAKPGVIAITKSNSVERIIEDCNASGWQLSIAQLRRLDEGVKFRQRGTFEVFLRRVARRVLDRPGYW
jgi:diketogulonate reductase-like aldo/keto reductase